MARPGRSVVDMVVARLPAPGDLKKGSSGARKRSKDDEGDVGAESAVIDFAKALGLKPKEIDVGAAVEAMKDLIAICSNSYEDDKDEDEE